MQAINEHHLMNYANTSCHSSRLLQRRMAGYAYLFKYIIIGDSATGKSCLLLQVRVNVAMYELGQ